MYGEIKDIWFVEDNLKAFMFDTEVFVKSFKEILDKSESFYGDIVDEYNKKFEEVRTEKGEEYADYFYDPREVDRKKESLPNFSRQGQLVTIYSFLDSQFKLLCYDLEIEKTGLASLSQNQDSNNELARNKEVPG